MSSIPPAEARATALVDYYSRRAPEYEAMWYRDDPARQAEQAAIVSEMRRLFRGRRVLEVACGTGYWTERIADAAEHLVAIDAAPEVLALARGKNLPPDKVEFRLGDAFALETTAGAFNAGLANFWLSHVAKARLEEFLAGFHRRLGAGAVVFLADNVYVPGVGGELVTPPDCADTFKRRTLADGSEHLVLKNYFGAGELRRMLSLHGTELSVRIGSCFWWVSYVVNNV